MIRVEMEIGVTKYIKNFDGLFKTLAELSKMEVIGDLRGMSKITIIDEVKEGDRPNQT